MRKDSGRLPSRYESGVTPHGVNPSRRRRTEASSSCEFRWCRESLTLPHLHQMHLGGLLFGKPPFHFFRRPTTPACWRAFASATRSYQKAAVLRPRLQGLVPAASPSRHAQYQPKDSAALFSAPDTIASRAMSSSVAGPSFFIGLILRLESSTPASAVRSQFGGVTPVYRPFAGTFDKSVIITANGGRS